MNAFIQQMPLKLMLFLLICINLKGCNASSSSHLKNYKQGKFIIPSGEEIHVYITSNEAEQRLGLSKIKDEDFDPLSGMLFPESQMRVRQFWMPETYFDLDVIFMNEDYYILDIHRNLKHNPHKANNILTEYSKKVFSQHVLEIKSSSPLAKKLAPGMTLKLKTTALLP